MNQFKLGKDDDQIAAELNLPKYRVRHCMKAILGKCGLATRAQLFLAVNAVAGKNG
jgi:DNA-binding NarL/FixJ family response regulator